MKKKFPISFVCLIVAFSVLTMLFGLSKITNSSFLLGYINKIF